MEQTELSSAPKTHSKVGIAAFALGVIPLCIFVIYIVFLGVDISNKLVLSDNFISPPTFYFIAFIVCALMGIAALILGVWALFQKERRKALPIAGLVLTLVSFVLWVSAFITLFLYTGG